MNEEKDNNVECKEFKDDQILRGIELILDGLRLDLNDENFRETPQRILRSYHEMFYGLHNDDEIKKILKTSFPTEYDGMIIEGPIQTYSMCPHHFLPVIYEVYIGYIPRNGGLGLSKLARLVEHLAKAPKLQEDFTKEIVNVLQTNLNPIGCMVLVEGQHLCMQMRGIKKPGCSTTTSSFTGAFKDAPVRNEFMSLIR